MASRTAGLHGMDVDELTGHVLAVVRDTMHPATASLWLRDGAPAGRMAD